jgi:hypothetical protein
MSNNPGEKFCLRWNEFEKNISTSFRELREDKDFFDVTLACENNQIQAHKVILSACSPFFRSVLKQNPHQHPLLYLKGVRYEDITSVLSCMYHGEVNISQDELNSFLEVAEDLKVKGLTQNNLNEEKSEIKPPAERKMLKQSPVLPIYKPQKQARPPPRPTFEAVSIRQESMDMQREIRNPQPQIKTEAPAVVDIDEEDPNQMVVSNEYQDDDIGYEEYQNEYDQQDQYEAVALTQNQASAGIIEIDTFTKHIVYL